MNEINWMQQGWECPKCGAVMAPHVSCCVNCRGNKGGGTATTITNPMTTEANWAEDFIRGMKKGCLMSDGQNSYEKNKDIVDEWERYYLNL